MEFLVESGNGMTSFGKKLGVGLVSDLNLLCLCFYCVSSLHFTSSVSAFPLCLLFFISHLFPFLKFLRRLLRCDSGVRRNAVCHFGESVHADIYCILTFRLMQYGLHLVRLTWNSRASRTFALALARA